MIHVFPPQSKQALNNGHGQFCHVVALKKAVVFYFVWTQLRPSLL